jgi:hypothetical protein
MSEEFNINETSFDSIEPENYEENKNESGDVVQEQNQHNFEISSIRIDDEKEFPLELDMFSEVQNILAAGIFKNVENINTYNKLCDVLLEKRFVKMTNLLFWIIFMLKFQPDDTLLLEKLRRRLSKTYSKFFATIKQPKDDLSNMSIFAAAYVSHITFFNIFPQERDLFDMRFILDCYHIVIHEIYGIFVSDFYIQGSIEKFFGNKFFHYEKRVHKKKKIEKKDITKELLLKDLSYDGRNLSYVSGGVDLAHELSSKLRKFTKKMKPSSINDLDSSKSTSPRRVMKLTEIEERSMMSGLSTSKSASYFPKIKFNCNQISPTVSTFLESSTQSLPFQKRKMMYYSNNKHVVEQKKLDYQPSMDKFLNDKAEKKEKKKSQGHNLISDYQLKNRPDDYYLNYMPKSMQHKFRSELDMKYILDNVHVSLRGWNSVKSLTEEVKKIHLPSVHTHMASILEKSEILESEKKNSEAEKELRINLATQDSTESIGISKENSFMDSAQGSATKQKGEIDLANSLLKGSRVSLFKKMVAPVIQESKSKISIQEEPKVQAAKMNFKVIDRSKRARMLLDLDDDTRSTLKSKYKYEDKRKQYISEHNALINRDTDAQIEDLVRRLKTKQNMFNVNFGKYAVQNRGKKK